MCVPTATYLLVRLSQAGKLAGGVSARNGRLRNVQGGKAGSSQQAAGSSELYCSKPGLVAAGSAAGVLCRPYWVSSH